MTTAYSKMGFSAALRQMADRVGNEKDGALAVRLRYKMVESRTTQSNGDIDLTIPSPDTLQGDTAAIWMQNFFEEAFPGMEANIRIDAPVNEKFRIHLTGEAAARYRNIMQNLDLAIESIEKDAPRARG